MINFELSAEEFVTKRCERNPLKITPWWCDDRRKTGTLPTYLQIRSLFHNDGGSMKTIERDVPFTLYLHVGLASLFTKM